MDSSAKIVSCMQLAANAANLSQPSEAQVKEIIGISLVPAIELLFDIGTDKAHEVAEHYKKVFISVDQTPCPLFPNVRETLNDLQNHFTLAVATGKARRGLERAWEMTNSKHFFSDSICSDEASSKPSPDMLLKLLDKWQIDASSALMVGDTIYDMKMAEMIDMPRVAVSFGVHQVNRLEEFGPIACIDCISELKKIALKSTHREK